MAEITGIASLNTNNFFLNIGIALLSEICLSAVTKSFAYLSHSLVKVFTSISLNFREFQSWASTSSWTIPENIFYFIVNWVFSSRKSLKFVKSVSSNTSSYFRCFFEYSSKFFILSTKLDSYLADFGTSDTSSVNLSAFRSSLISSDYFSNFSKEDLIYLLKISIYLGIWFSHSAMVKVKVADMADSSVFFCFYSWGRIAANYELSIILNKILTTWILYFWTVN